MYVVTGRNEEKEVGRGLSGGRRSWQVTETEESMAHMGKEQLFRMIWIEDKFEKWWEIRLRGQSRGMIHQGVRMISAGGTKEFQKLYAGEWYYPISILEISVRLLCGGTKDETGDQERIPAIDWEERKLFPLFHCSWCREHKAHSREYPESQASPTYSLLFCSIKNIQIKRARHMKRKSRKFRMCHENLLRITLKWFKTTRNDCKLTIPQRLRRKYSSIAKQCGYDMTIFVIQTLSALGVLNWDIIDT